jgi:hypothetical protein
MPGRSGQTFGLREKESAATQAPQCLTVLVIIRESAATKPPKDFDDVGDSKGKMVAAKLHTP